MGLQRREVASLQRLRVSSKEFFGWLLRGRYEPARGQDAVMALLTAFQAWSLPSFEYKHSVIFVQFTDHMQIVDTIT